MEREQRTMKGRSSRRSISVEECAKKVQRWPKPVSDELRAYFRQEGAGLSRRKSDTEDEMIYLKVSRQ